MPRYGAILLALLLWVGAASAAEMSGDAILQKSADVYLALTSYQGMTAVQEAMPAGETARAPGADISLTFARPGKIRLMGYNAQGKTLAIISDGTDTWCAELSRNKGAYEKAASVEAALAALAAPAAIPALLMNLNGGHPYRGAQGSRLEGRETIRGFDCYKVIADVAGTRRTIWVDSSKFLLRQMKEEPGAAVAGERGSGPPSRSWLSTFVTLQFNEPVDERKFQAPMRPFSLFDLSAGGGRILEK